MELAGISDDTEDPVGGQIIRDKEGKATGVFVDTAMSYIREQIPATSSKRLLSPCPEFPGDLWHYQCS